MAINSNVIAGSDTSSVDVRRFEKSSIENYRNSDDFFYLDEEKAGKNYLETLKRYLIKFLSAVFGNKASIFIIGNFHYLIITIAVVLILFKINKLYFYKRRSQNRSIDELDYIEDLSEVENIDFEKLIEKATEANNYRLAIRYNYLSMLKKLALAGKIEPSTHKTNMEYIYEIDDDSLRNGFKQLAYIFDYVWYGDIKLDPDKYEVLLVAFSEFDNNVKQKIS